VGTLAREVEWKEREVHNDEEVAWWEVEALMAGVVLVLPVLFLLAKVLKLVIHHSPRMLCM
jgi:hypothetical protein